MPDTMNRRHLLGLAGLAAAATGLAACGRAGTPSALVAAPSGEPSPDVSGAVTASPSDSPSGSPSASPSTSPSASPSAAPTPSPSPSPTASPSRSPSASPSRSPSPSPSKSRSTTPSTSPSGRPTAIPANPNLSSNDALARLTAGNKRWASGKPIHPDQSVKDRQSLAGDQTAFAVIVGCTDSRVPPELVFDQGIGQIAVIRSAAEALDDLGLGSVEGAIADTGANLIYVLGHTDCESIAMARTAFATNGGNAPGHQQNVVDILGPADDLTKGESVDEMAREQVRQTVATLRNDPTLVALQKNGLQVVGGFYRQRSGLATVIM